MRNSIQTYKWWGLTVIVLLSGVLLAGCVGEEDPQDPEATIEGTWAGVMNYTYYCEAEPGTIQLDITDTTITITGGDFFTVDATGTVSQQTNQSYTVTLNDGGSILGQLFVDLAKEYALLVTYASPGGDEGIVGVLQKGTLSSITYQESDLVGSWLGVAVRVNTSFEVTDSSVSSATITDSDGLELNGSDGDGSFTASAVGIDLESGYEPYGIYVSGWGSANQVSWPGDDTYDAMYALSYDKSVLAVAFLKSVCSIDIFSTDNLPIQKFALWLKQ